MLIVVSDTAFRADESNIINALFDEGLQRFHLRKPQAAVSEVQSLLEAINPIHCSKIALHQHHSLAARFGCKTFHFPEAMRKQTNEEKYRQLRKEGYTLSTSIHTLEENDLNIFDYAFYGPVFNSISKKGYTGITHSTFSVHNSKLIAIGGIDEHNCVKAFDMGFTGVAVLGAIWQSTEPVKQFKKLQSKCSSIVPL